MRILHTADWHLGDSLRTVSRTEDLRRRVEQVADVCRQQDVDVVLIAGDLFSEQCPVKAITESLEHLHAAFASFFRQGGTILAVTGNHDHEHRIEMVRASMRLAAPTTGPHRFETGRMYLLNGPYFGTLETRAGKRGQFVLMPYPTTSRYAESADQFRTKDEEHRALQGRVAEELDHAQQHAEFDKSLPTVLVAHLHVRGAELHSLYRLSERDDVVFEAGFLPTNWAYLALGHIHKPQSLGGLGHVRYAGSLDRLDFSERLDDKGVLVFDLGAAGLEGEPVWHPLPATPMYDLTLPDSLVDLDELADRYPQREQALVRVRLTHNPAGPSRPELTQRFRRLFPRLTEIEWLKPATLEGAGRAGFQPRADFRSDVRRYLADSLDKNPVNDREALLSLAEEFLAQEDPA